tara:strand:- start:2976 stop:3611 length:636 start_codon:yes stop_codon:yes gene_type:complete
MESLEIQNLGCENYETTFVKMKNFTKNRDNHTADQIWMVQHFPVFTLGAGANIKNILFSGDIPIVKSDRGGDVTYHAPGQAIVYLLFNLKRFKSKLKPKIFIKKIEQAVISTLKEYNIDSEYNNNFPGVYLSNGDLKGSKIASLGLRITNGFSYHGVSLNVKMDLTPFSWINPCGRKGLRVVDISNIIKDISLEKVHKKLAFNLQHHLNKI